ncbi:MAG TPA: Ku protein [Solirubrobacteraceae bacterium]|jgi:DNA end-binding protein Ku|nr:Ku protein [Solirubrobacteraceae bacterium]
MAARSIWNGTIVFGEVVVPVKLFSAAQEHAVHFHEVRLSDGCRIVHRRVGADSGREVPTERIGKAYETSRGHQVVLEDDEIAAARGSRPKVIEIEHFVAGEEIDPVYYDHPYILGARDEGERPYRVLHDALKRSGRVGIGRFVLRTREQLIALAPRDGALELHTMRFADEVVDHDDLDAPALRREPSAKEVKVAEALIDSLSESWRPSAHTDRYRKDVLALIKRKAKGEKAQEPEHEAPEPPTDLLAALQESMTHRSPKKTSKTAAKAPAKRAKAKPNAASKAGSGGGRAAGRAKAETH